MTMMEAIMQMKDQISQVMTNTGTPITKPKPEMSKSKSNKKTPHHEDYMVPVKISRNSPDIVLEPPYSQQS